MSCKEEDDSRLTPAEDDDAAGRKIDRKECLLLIEDQYKIFKREDPFLTCRKSVGLKRDLLLTLKGFIKLQSFASNTNSVGIRFPPLYRI